MRNTILICDDQEGIRQSLELVLSDLYPLILCESGARCLECLRRTPDIRLVLLDIKMPGENGLELLKQIRELRPDVKVVIVTGYKSVDTVAESVRLGAVGYVPKPFRREEILAAVERGMGSNNG